MAATGKWQRKRIWLAVNGRHGLNNAHSQDSLIIINAKIPRSLEGRKDQLSLMSNANMDGWVMNE